MCHCTMPLLVQTMACRLFGAKPLSAPMLMYCQLDPRNILITIETFSSKKMYSKMLPAEWQPFCLDLSELTHFIIYIMKCTQYDWNTLRLRHFADDIMWILFYRNCCLFIHIWLNFYTLWYTLWFTPKWVTCINWCLVSFTFGMVMMLWFLA